MTGFFQDCHTLSAFPPECGGNVDDGPFLSAGLNEFWGYEGKMLRGSIFCCAVFLATMAQAADKPSAADTIAQKFAEQSQPAATSQAKSPDPHTAQPPASQSEALKAQPVKVKPPKPAALPAAVTARSERPPLDYEMEMLRQARAEQASTAATAPKPAEATTTPQVTSPALPFAGAPIAAAAQMEPSAAPVSPAPAEPAVVPPPPLVRSAESAAPPVPAKPEATAKVEANPVQPAPAAVVAAAPAARATLLLALETGGASNQAGAAPAFDPLVCLGDTCFVSAGLNSDAVKLSKPDALKLKSTSDASSDSCRGKAGCVFRNVLVPVDAQIQVIELGSATHETVRASPLQLDTTCKTADGDLNCDNPILTADYRLWVVPEDVAKSAGVPAVEEAVADGLPHLDVARATDK